MLRFGALKFALGMNLLFSLATVATAQAVEEPIVINVPQEIPKNGTNTVQLSAVRSLSSTLVVGYHVQLPSTSDDAYFIPEKVLIGAWLTDPYFSSALRKAGINQKETLTIRKIQESGINLKDFAWGDIGTDFRSAYPFSLEEVNISTAGPPVDAASLKAMTNFGMLDLEKTYPPKLDLNNGAMVAFAPNISPAVYKIYSNMEFYKDVSLLDPRLRERSPILLLKNASTKFPLNGDAEKALTFSLGEASYGVSRVRTAKEMGFKVDSSIASREDVYFIEFSVTMRNLPTDMINELSFEFDCKSSCTAWELAPLRVSTTEEVTETLKTPEITFKDLSVGEFFSRTVTYKIIKPEVTGYGLREDRFSWSLQKQAIREGSHVFLAAIGVPKNAKSLEISRFVSAKTKEGWIAESDFAKSVESIEVIPMGKKR
ncbi:MAG: hypothetical protein ACKVP5_14670 [Aestuariivirga sp.]